MLKLKIMVRLLILLLLVDGLLLYMHYRDAGNLTAKGHGKSTYSQEIEVTNRPDGLYIRHHFKDLSAKLHTIEWPTMSTKRSCYMEDSVACSRLDEDLTAFVEGDGTEQSIMYVIPKEHIMQKTALYKNIFASLSDSESSANVLHLTDEMGLGGLWVNGLELVGSKKMDLIDYALFQGYGELTDLYWQRNHQPIAYEGNQLSVFGTSADVEMFKETDEVLGSVNATHATIVIDEENPPIVSNRFTITNGANAKGIAEGLLVNNTYNRFELSKEARLSAEIVTSLLSEKAIGDKKTHLVYEALNENLSETELQQVVKKVDARKGETMNAAVLDDVLQEVTGYKSSYFEKNNNTDQPLYPFLLEDPRQVHINGEEHSDVAIILNDGKILYPATQIMRKLGFDIKSNEQSLYIEGNMGNFRFPMKEPFYVYNERKYNLSGVPFERIGDEFYFQEAPFIRIFIVGINKTGDNIEIVQRVNFKEEGADK